MDISEDGVITLAGPHRSDPILRGSKGRLHYYVGLDLGFNDPAAQVIVEDRQEPLPAYDASGQQLLSERALTVVFADRLRETRYPDIARSTVSLLQRPPVAGKWTLVIDCTGVGRAFSDFCDDQGLKHVAIQMTAGSSVSKVGKFLNVGKWVLLTDLAAALESKRLRIASNLPLKNEFLAELDSFQINTTAAGNQVIDASAQSHHADMGVAAALALHVASQKRGFTGEGRLDNFW